ncbi:MAG: hypothetical protein ABJA11_04955 [Pseudolysinimonas sp.]
MPSRATRSRTPWPRMGTTTYFEVLNGGHVLGALNGGLDEGYKVLYPRLGLVAPEVAP